MLSPEFSLFCTSQESPLKVRQAPRTYAVWTHGPTTAGWIGCPPPQTRAPRRITLNYTTKACPRRK
jgi:hypothetical protein